MAEKTTTAPDLNEKNSYTFYPTGIVDVERVLTLKKGQKHRMSLAVKKDYVGDIAGTISILGDCLVEETPNYPVQDTKLLKLDTGNLTRSLIETLAGAKVKLNLTNGRDAKGLLSGLDRAEKDHGTFKTTEYQVGLVEDDGNMRRIPLVEVLGLHFQDQKVVAQIQNALRTNIEKTKPDSSFINLTLVGTKDNGRAVVQFAQPAPAWKSSYRIFVTKKGVTIQGFAHVENDGDDDMQGKTTFAVSRPNSMRLQQLAQIITIEREQADLVNRQVTGSVSVEASAGGRAAGSRGYERMPSAAPQMASFSAQEGSLADATGAVEELDYYLPAHPTSETTVAVTPEASRFTSSGEVKIPAGTGTAALIFTSRLPEANTVLFYKSNSGLHNPFRALRFINQLGHSLPNGVHTLYEEGNFIGQSLPKRTFHNNETVFLPYATDTAVVIRPDYQGVETQQTRIDIKKGYAHAEQLSTATMEYQIKSVQDKPYECIIDHTQQLAQSKLTVKNGEVLETTVTGTVRIKCTVPANDEMAVQVIERHVDSSQHYIGNDLGWLNTNIIATQNSISSNPTLRKAVELQGQIDTLALQVEEAQVKVRHMTTEQGRLRENLKLGNQGANSETLQKWQLRLDKTGDELNKLEQEQIPDLTRRIEALKPQLRATLSEITAEWSADPAKTTKA